MRKVILAVATILSFLFITLYSGLFNVNAMSLNKTYSHTLEDGTGYFKITLNDETKALVEMEDENHVLVESFNLTYKEIDENNIHLINEKGIEIIKVTFNNDAYNTCEILSLIPDKPVSPEPTPVEPTPEPVEPIEPKPVEPTPEPSMDEDLPKGVKWVKDYVIAFVVALLGNGFFLSLVKAFTNKGTKALKNKIKELHEQNKIATDAVEKYVGKIDELEAKINDILNKNDEVLNDLRNKLEVDKEKEAQMAQLLDELLPKLVDESGVDNGKEKIN